MNLLFSANNLLLLFFFIFLICFYILITIKSKRTRIIIEPYSDLLEDMTLENCAEFCKTTAGCYGFGFDDNNNHCYISNDVVLGKPVIGLYNESYDKDRHTICNKMNTVINPSNTVPFNDRRSNALFMCSTGESLQPQLYYHNKNKLVRIDEGQNLDFMTDVDNYEVKFYKWSINKFTDNDRGLLKQVQSSQYDIDRITNLHNIVTHQFPNINTMFKRYNESNVGEYLKSFGCLKGVSHESCNRYCTNNPSCVGYEWNPKYNQSENVCCPYRTLGHFIPRKIVHKYGKFYLKTDVLKFDPTLSYVYFERYDNN